MATAECSAVHTTLKRYESESFGKEEKVVCWHEKVSVRSSLMKTHDCKKNKIQTLFEHGLRKLPYLLLLLLLPLSLVLFKKIYTHGG